MSVKAYNDDIYPEEELNPVNCSCSETSDSTCENKLCTSEFGE